jgi:hypothetical protein
MALKHSQPGKVAWRWLALIGLALFLIAMTARAAAAENLGPGGSRVLIGDQVIGPYRLLVTSSPNPAATGTVTFVVRVSDPQTGVNVRDAQVEVELEKGGTTLKHAATHEDAGNSVDYAAHIDITEEGSWNGAVRVVGPLGASEGLFLQQVITPRALNTVILVGIPFAAILLVFVAFWLARTRKAAAGDPGIAQAGNK